MIHLADAKVAVFVPESWDKEKIEETAELVTNELEFSMNAVTKHLVAEFGEELEFKIEL